MEERVGGMLRLQASFDHIERIHWNHLSEC